MSNQTLGPGDPLRIHLACGGASASIALEGAELQSLHLGGYDLLREPDAAWSATSPILFPIVGWARDGEIRVAGQTYPMGVHGFAAAQTFSCLACSSDTATFQLVDTDQSRQSYPFAFDLRVHYRLSEIALSMVLEIRNPGQTSLPYACGFHPGLRWPFAGGAADDYAIAFDVDEVPSVPVIAPGGLFSSERRAIPLNGRSLPLSHALMAQEALCFLNLRSQKLAFGKASDLQTNSGPVVEFEFENMPHMALWAKPPSSFLCVEAWTGHGDPVGFRGDLADKPSMLHLQPEASATHGMRIALRS